jgi:hypothetical protein
MRKWHTNSDDYFHGKGEFDNTKNGGMVINSIWQVKEN